MGCREAAVGDLTLAANRRLTGSFQFQYRKPRHTALALAMTSLLALCHHVNTPGLLLL